MQRTVVAAAAAVCLVLAVTSVAAGALPKKNGVYVGEIKSSPFTMKVVLGVTPAGTAARVTYHCGTGRPTTTVYGMKIDPKGYFKFESNPANGQAWKLAGHFTSPTSAFVSLNSISCGGSKGSAKLKLKA